MNKQEYIKKWIDERPFLKKWKHQEDILLDTTYEQPVVWAVGTSGGKTLMSIIEIDWLLYNNPDWKILVLTHNSQNLRLQFWEKCEYYKPNFSYNKVENWKDFDNFQQQIMITLPATIHECNLPNFNFLVVDEAHQFYFANSIFDNDGIRIDGMVNKIIRQSRVGNNQLLLTGTPSPFILKGGFKIHFVPVENLYKTGMISVPKIEICTSIYNFHNKDYNTEGDIIIGRKYTKTETIATLDQLLDKLIKKLRSVFPSDIQNYNWYFAFKKLKKTIFICGSIEQAGQIKEYFDLKNINSTISVSNGKWADSNSEEIENFNRDKDVLILILVFKGNLGYDNPKLMNIIDMSCSKNPNRILQIFGRLLRINEDDDTQKLYIKLVPHNQLDIFLNVMSAVMSLTTMEFFSKYNGKNLDLVEYNVIEKTYNKIKNKFKVGKKQKTIIKSTYDFLDVPIPFISLYHNEDKILNTTHKVSLGEAIKFITGIQPRNKWSNLSDDNFLEKLKYISIENKHTSLKDMSDDYDGRCGRSELVRRKLSKQFCEMMGWEYLDLGKWSNLSDDEFLEKLKEISIENGYTRLKDLMDNEISGYTLLLSRKLTKKFSEIMNWEYRIKNWSELSNEKLLDDLMNISLKFTNLKQLRKSKYGSTGYSELVKRKLSKRFCEMMGWEYLDLGKWSNLSDDEFLEKLKEISIENGYTKLQDLRKNNNDCSVELRKRKLSKKFHEIMGWTSQMGKWRISDDDFLKKLKEKSIKKGYKNISDIRENNSGDILQLYKRKLSRKFIKTMVKMGWTTHHKWGKMSDDDLLEKLKESSIKNNCKTMSELVKYNSGDLAELYKRKLSKKFHEIIGWKKTEFQGRNK